MGNKRNDQGEERRKDVCAPGKKNGEGNLRSPSGMNNGGKGDVRHQEREMCGISRSIAFSLFFCKIIKIGKIIQKEYRKRSVKSERGRKKSFMNFFFNDFVTFAGCITNVSQHRAQQNHRSAFISDNFCDSFCDSIYRHNKEQLESVIRYI